MSIITVIDSVVSQMDAGGKTYVCQIGTKSFLNALSTYTQYPAVGIAMPIVSKLTINQSGFKSRTYPLVLFFMFKSEIGEWTHLQHEQQAIDPARVAVDNFLNILEKHPDVDSVDMQADELEFLNLWDANTSGIILNVKIKLRNNNTICTS